MNFGMIWFAPRLEDRKGFSKLIYVLPESEENPNGFEQEKEKSGLNIVDLTLPEEAIYAQFHRNTRYEITIAKRYPLSVEYNQHYAEAAGLLTNFLGRKKLKFPSRLSEKELRQGKHLLVEGYLDRELLHVSYLLLHGTLAYQIFTGSKDMGKKQNLASIVARFSHFEAMKKLKAEGSTEYCFGAISDSRPTTSAFKLSFGGKIIGIPTYIKIYNPLLKLTSAIKK